MGKFLTFFGIQNDGFKPYYQNENAFKRIVFIHAIGALIIAPIYTYFVVNFGGVSENYFYIGISYTLSFPVYVTICWLIKPMREKLYYVLIFHYFIITFLAFQSLIQHSFSTRELFCFMGVFAVGSIHIQRLYSFLLYIVFVFLLFWYGFTEINDLPVSKFFVLGMYLIIALSAFLVLIARLRLVNEIEDYAGYLKKVIDTPGKGYVLFDYRRRLKIIDYNNELCRFFNMEVSSMGARKILKRYLSQKDFDEIKDLKTGTKYTKRISFNKYGVKYHVEIQLSTISLKKADFYLARINDISEDVHKREELEISEKRYRNLYYKNRAGVFTIDHESRIINGNASFFEMFEHTVRAGDKLFSGRNEEDWDLIIQSLGDKENSKNFQTQFKLKNGGEKIFIFSWYLDARSQNVEGSVIDLTSIQKTSQALRQSEEKYRLIYEESNDAILLLDGDKIIDVNRKAIQLFGIPQNSLLGKDLYELSANKDETVFTEYSEHKNRLNNSRNVKFNWLFVRNNRLIEAEVTMIEITLGTTLYYQCVIQDKTEQNKNLRAIKKNQRNLENILENNPEGILIVKDDNVLYSNPEIERLVGTNFSCQELFISEDQEKFNRAFEQNKIDKIRQNIQLNLRDKYNEELLMDVTLVSTHYEEEEATLVIMKDVSVQNTLAKEKLRAELAEESNKKLAAEIMERIKTERLLEEQFLRTKAILDSSSNTFLLTLTLSSEISSYNTHSMTYFLKIFGRKLKSEVHFNEYFKDNISPVRLRLFNRYFQEVCNGKSRQFEIKMETLNKEYWLEIFMNPIYDTEGTVAEISLVAHDISEKKKTSIEIEESLKEKEVLLKEIHHRVKNNLQVISSILNLQSSFVEDEKTLDILEESRNRIRSMAIIHENLYRTEDFSSINFSNYLDNLSANLIASYRIDDLVTLKSNLEDVDLILDQAIPCGLLVNELISNALKYAWKEGDSGEIILGLYEKEGKVTLEIADNGVGLPTDFEKMQSDTLGLQLVVTLVEQLDGEITVDNKNGTKYLIKFDNHKSLS